MILVSLCYSFQWKSTNFLFPLKICFWDVLHLTENLEYFSQNMGHFFLSSKEFDYLITTGKFFILKISSYPNISGIYMQKVTDEYMKKIESVHKQKEKVHFLFHYFAWFGGECDFHGTELSFTRNCGEDSMLMYLDCQLLFNYHFDFIFFNLRPVSCILPMTYQNLLGVLLTEHSFMFDIFFSGIADCLTAICVRWRWINFVKLLKFSLMPNYKSFLVFSCKCN